MIASYLKPSLDSSNGVNKLTNHKKLYVAKKNQLMIKMEFMFGKQLNLSSSNKQKWKNIV